MKTSDQNSSHGLELLKKKSAIVVTSTMDQASEVIRWKQSFGNTAIQFVHPFSWWAFVQLKPIISMHKLVPTLRAELQLIFRSQDIHGRSKWTCILRPNHLNNDKFMHSTFELYGFQELGHMTKLLNSCLYLSASKPNFKWNKLFRCQKSTLHLYLHLLDRNTHRQVTKPNSVLCNSIIDLSW